MEIDKRKFNLILHGINESENGEDGDVDLVNEILRSKSIDLVRHVEGCPGWDMQPQTRSDQHVLRLKP